MNHKQYSRFITRWNLRPRGRWNSAQGARTGPARDVRSGGAFRPLRRATPQRPVPSRVAKPHRRVCIPAPRHEVPSRRKMRFHRVINLGTRRAARRDGFDTCGLLRVCLGGPGAARSGHVPGSCPSFACQDLHPLAKRGRRAPPLFFRKLGIRMSSRATSMLAY